MHARYVVYKQGNLKVTEILQNTRRNYEEQLVKKGMILMISDRVEGKKISYVEKCCKMGHLKQIMQ
jgi:hypothetical protein